MIKTQIGKIVWDEYEKLDLANYPIQIALYIIQDEPLGVNGDIRRDLCDGGREEYHVPPYPTPTYWGE